MKAVFSKADFVNLIGKMQGIVAPKPTLPILGNILVQAIDDQLIVSATDLTNSMTCSMEAKVIEEGAITLPARRLFQLVRELASAQVKISVDAGEIAEITAGSSVFKINGMGRAEFPATPDLAGAAEFQVSALKLKEVLSKTSFSAARDDSRYMLNGLQLKMADGKATFTSTDGKRLAKAATAINGDSSIQGSYVLPIKAVEEMIKILPDDEAHVNLTLATDKIALESGSVTLISKLLSGQYPDVERVIPATLKTQFSVHREELMGLLRQVSLFTSEESSSVRFTFESGQLHLSAMSSQIGEGRVSMPVDYDGARFEIAFNPFLLIDILRHTKDETLKVALNDSHAPGLFTDASNALFVLMPMRLSEAPAASSRETASVS